MSRERERAAPRNGSVPHSVPEEFENIRTRELHTHTLPGMSDRDME